MKGWFIRYLGVHRGSGDARPLHVEGAGPAVLCLHGFSGSPFEVRPPGEALGNAGFSVLSPWLAGHEGGAKAFAASRYPDWLKSAETALNELVGKNAGRPVGIFGFSMGGLLAVCLAHAFPKQVGALALGAVPLRLGRNERFGIRVLGALPRFLTESPLLRIPKMGGSDVCDPVARQENPGMPVMPVSGLKSLIELQDHARALLPELRIPVLVVHGEKDQTVPLADSHELMGCLGSTDIESLWLKRSGHLVGVDVEKHQLSEALVRFFLRTLTASQI
ncbi:MAG: alpha/beta fold hydrolase [Deltaproteobacteria bacterium]|nr:alpha/beta fold hydrolase [Deltaproteobacteria bacterium]